MRLNALVFRGEAVCHRHIEWLERLHLPIKPFLRVRPILVRPAHSGSK